MESDKLNREMSLEIKKRLEVQWKGKGEQMEHRGRLRWTKEWLLEIAVEPARTTKLIWDTVSVLVVDLADETILFLKQDLPKSWKDCTWQMERGNHF